jgi:3-oxoacyl-[acyl-carrier-protein] synthase-3
MYINGVASYLPAKVLPNSFFETCGITDDWIKGRTGIEERRICPDGENANTMGIEAVKNLLTILKEDGQNFDLIIGASYTPYDTVATLAHQVQHFLKIPDVPTLYVSTACSSVLNAVEIAEGYFALGKAKRALIIGSEHNTGYVDLKDKVSGPLWGDGAVAFAISKERMNVGDLEIKHISTGGAAHTPKAIKAVYLQPIEHYFPMADGRDVFINACVYMERESRKVLEKFNLNVDQIDYYIPHQANHRISLHVVKELGMDESKLIANIQKYGNTGCCGFGIGVAETWDKFKKGDKILSIVFGGGYSFGAMYMEK